ncbi:hypothetical protein MRX96_043486 [Rhipicephalus microplus]
MAVNVFFIIFPFVNTRRQGRVANGCAHDRRPTPTGRPGYSLEKRRVHAGAAVGVAISHVLHETSPPPHPCNGVNPTADEELFEKPIRQLSFVLLSRRNQ